MLSAEVVQTAYCKLKQLVYYDKTDLCLRLKLAKFECATDFDSSLLDVERVVNSSDPLKEPLFKKWSDTITFRIVPKSLKNNDCSTNNGSDQNETNNKGKFLTNVTSAKTLQVEKVNYFFDGPVELHLIAILWIMTEGRFLDAQLDDECCGSRLEDEVGVPDDLSAKLFHKYHEQYAKWRDMGIRKAKQLLTEEQKSVCILGLDIQEYYYHIRLDFDAIGRAVHDAAIEAISPDEDTSESVPSQSRLLLCIEAICHTFREKLKNYLKLTHQHLSDSNAGIPIGLCSSYLLGNWYLRDFDRAVKRLVRPAYYGRYVDDILLVIPTSEDPSKDGTAVATLVDRVLVQTNILKQPQEGRYEIKEPGGLFLQQSKCILQYFEVNHSIAGLDKFQKKLEENSSDFLLLPVDEGDNSLEDVAYDLLYEGSVNKFRSVEGVVENRYELAKYLLRQTMLHLLTDDPPDRQVSLGLRKFFKGRNAIEFHDLWERVFTFFRIANDATSTFEFAKQLKAEISRVRFQKNSRKYSPITKGLRVNLASHLELCMAMANALAEVQDFILPSSEEMFQRSNLVRHHFVRLPLLNYTSYTGSFLTRSVSEQVEQDRTKFEHSPRYVHFDECLLLANSGNLKATEKSGFQLAMEFYKDINGREVDGVEWKTAQMKEDTSDD